MELKAVDFLTIQKYFVDFQKHSKCLEMPPEESVFLGIYEKDVLIGYFIVVTYTDKSADIIQGYLLPQHRHKGKPKEAMKALEAILVKKQYKTIRLQTNNRFKSYMLFASALGYKPERLVFSKEI